MPKNNAVLYPPDVIQAMSLGNGDYPLSPDSAGYAWRFLAEGDSWFTIGAIPSSNLLYELRLRQRAVVLNLGYPGDTIANIAQLSANTEFSRRLASPQWASDWNAILLSGGGNDLIDQAGSLIREVPGGSANPGDSLDAATVTAFRERIKTAYRAIVALRDAPGSPSKNKPIVVHTYDYPTPRPSPATFIIVPITRPWMHPVFQKRNVPKGLRFQVAGLLLDALASALLELAGELPAFHVVDTRRCLVPAKVNAKGNSGDWLNEIHPNGDGYRKIAAKLAEALHALLGG